MKLPDGFQFSQGSLQDFTECKRRFQLHYIRRLAWPAVASEPALKNERAMQMGSNFHKLIHQYILGVDAQRTVASSQDVELTDWWHAFLSQAEGGGMPWLEAAQVILPEVMVSAPLGNYRLVGKFDLLSVSSEGKVTIVDWKTSQRQPRKDWLNRRLQTIVYPYLLLKAGSGIIGWTPDPKQVEMIYWYVVEPSSPVVFSYSLAQSRQDNDQITSLLSQIEGLDEDGFDMTSEEKHCVYCVYRSLCDRGEKAGEWEDDTDLDMDIPDETEIGFDFEQISEIAY